MRVNRIVAFALTVALSGGFLATGTVSAYACNITRGHDIPVSRAHYAYTAAVLSGASGVGATILEYDPLFTQYYATGTNASVMLTESATLSKWAQFGWFKMIYVGSVLRKTGLQYNIDFNANQTYFKWFNADTLGSSFWHQIQYEPSSGYYNFFFGPSKTLMWSANEWGSFVPNQYEIMGETHDGADQMPGGTGHHVTLYNSNYWTGPEHTSHLVTSAITTDTPYGASGITNYDIWDRSCTN